MKKMTDFDPERDIILTEHILMKIKTSSKLQFDTIINKIDSIVKKLGG